MNGAENNRNSLKYWNDVHESIDYKRDSIITDDWLDLVEEDIEKCKTAILDLGCGGGNNTLSLVNKKKRVMVCDFSQNAIDKIIRNFPEISDAKCVDMLEGLPYSDKTFEIVIADLCLHYFLKKDTERIIGDIQRILTDNGKLIFRVNSVNDMNHGAGQGELIEKNVYQTVDGTIKRFFDEDDIRYFFRNFEILYLKEESMTRYKLEKKVFRVCVQNKTGD